MMRWIRARGRAMVRALSARVWCTAESGQSTTEYTLVLLVAATVALLLLNWVNGGAVVAFFDSIFAKVTEMFA